jgi:hypothetical protein
MSEKIIMYLWVLHGSNVAAVHNFYPFETKFNSILFYSKPYTEITEAELDSLYANPCSLLTSTCPKVPITDSITGKKKVFLPPLVFSGEYDTTKFVTTKIGLFLIELEIQKQFFGTSPFGPSFFGQSKNICKVNRRQQIYYNKDLLNLGNTITYSTLFNMVTDYVVKRGGKPEDIILGIFSCQVHLYELDNRKTITNLVPRVVNMPEKTNIYNITDNQPNPDSYASISVIFPKKIEPTLQIRLQQQGCGLGILSYYGIIQQEFATEQSVCLTLKGTSIFAIIDYINDYLINKEGIVNPGYSVLRYPFSFGMRELFLFSSEYKSSTFAIIFKMYKEKEVNNKPSHIGHTVSLYKHFNRIDFIDPQIGFNGCLFVFYNGIYYYNKDVTLTGRTDQQIVSDNIILTVDNLDQYILGNFNYQITSIYKVAYNFIDIIFTIRGPDKDGKNPFDDDKNRRSSTFTQFKDYAKQNNLEFLNRTIDITHGGKKFKKIKTNKGKKRRHTKNKKNKNRTKRMIKNKKTIKNYRGGVNEESDTKNVNTNVNINSKAIDYEELVKKIDQENKVESLIIPENECKIST